MPASLRTTVLVADDTAFVRDRFKTALEHAGHRAIAVKSAAELLARVRADLAQIDLLVIDLRLPHQTGVELVRSVRKIDSGRLTILVFSGTISSAEEVRELASLGVAGYINEYSAVQHILPSLAPHLFPDSFNRRGSPRVVLGVPIAYRFGNTSPASAQQQPRWPRDPNDEPLDAERGQDRFACTVQTRDRSRRECCLSDSRVGMGWQFEKVDQAIRRPSRIRRCAFCQRKA